MDITIHADPNIDWQKKRANCFAIGLRKLGFEPELTRSRTRISDAPAVLYGTTLWRGIEQAEGDWLLVDRASVGDPDYVQLVWNGRGRRGDHMVPAAFDSSRWHDMGVTLERWQTGAKVVVCGQTDNLLEWYAGREEATHFRTHPAGGNPTNLPEWNTWDDVRLAYTFNSSVAIDALIKGVPVVVMDQGGMACSWPHESRLALMEWIAWTQWGWSEIRDGEPIRHLFEWLK